MNDTIFRLLATVIFLAGAIISSYFRRKADRDGGGKVSIKEEKPWIRVFLRVFGLFLWLVVFAYLINPSWVAWASVMLPDWARWIGVGMGVIADVLSYWVFSSLGNNVSPTVVTRQNHRLVTSGPYRWVRHPLYGMGLIAYLGFALLSENVLIAVLSVLVTVVLVFRLPQEEERLIERFGDEYRAYMQRTGKFLPKLR